MKPLVAALVVVAVVLLALAPELPRLLREVAKAPPPTSCSLVLKDGRVFRWAAREDGLCYSVDIVNAVE